MNYKFQAGVGVMAVLLLGLFADWSSEQLFVFATSYIVGSVILSFLVSKRP